MRFPVSPLAVSGGYDSDNQRLFDETIAPFLTTRQSHMELYDILNIYEGLDLGIRGVRIANSESCLALGVVRSPLLLLSWEQNGTMSRLHVLYLVCVPGPSGVFRSQHCVLVYASFAPMSPLMQVFINVHCPACVRQERRKVRKCARRKLHAETASRRR